MRVFVVMGNDYPDRVYDTQQAADDFCRQKNNESAAQTEKGYRRIYWRYYEFELQTEKTT